MITKDTPRKLFLLDAYALIYRAYFAFSNNPRVNSKGLNTSAIFGFTNTLLEVINKEKPSHLAVVFDLAEPTERHKEFSDYKANREEMPEDLQKCIPYIFQLLEAFNIPALSFNGYEADDVIGTLALQAENLGYTTYMMTSDKDYGQLVDANTFIYKPARSGNGAEILGVEEICKKWEIKEVAQLKDILGLMGDSVDNIPGIPGVGEKTAISLIKDFGSIDGIYQNTDKLKGKLKEKVEQNKDLAYLSKKLATIVTDLPIELHDEALAVKPLNKEKVKELFMELEFRRLAQQLLGEEIPGLKENIQKKNEVQNGQTNLFDEQEVSTDTEKEEEPAPKILKTIHDVPHQYFAADTSEKRTALIEQLQLAEVFCFDTETTSLDTISAELVGMSFAIKKHEAWYVPVPENRSEALTIVNEFKMLFADEDKCLIGQNIKYDLEVMMNYGITIKNKMFDTMIAHFLINPDMRHGMDVLAETYLDYSPISIEQLIGKKGKGQMSMRMVPEEQITDYAAEDADITFQLREKFEPLLKENNLEKLFNEVEVPLLKVLAGMEREGVKINREILHDYSKKLDEDVKLIEQEIQKLAGTSFNISSPKQVGEILFDYLKIVDNPKKTKTGQYGTGEDVLSKLVDKHPIVGKILEYREVLKLKNTYVDTLPLLVNPLTGRVHTTYNQVVAVTGRLSSDNPNLQNIPVRTERGRYIRKAFIPRDSEHVLLSADYSQIELRIVASISGDQGMCDAFRNGMDIHTATAAKVYGISPEEVTKEMRYKAKSVNFGIIYGQGAFGLAENLHISRTEARELIENYFRQYQGIRQYMNDQVEFARANGFVQTLLGRRRYLRDINSRNAAVRGFAERNAVNAPIQGTAADMIKLAMIRIDEKMREMQLKSKMILQVHDELVFDVFKPELALLKPMVETEMKNALPLEVPIEVGMGTGENWLEAH